MLIFIKKILQFARCRGKNGLTFVKTTSVPDSWGLGRRLQVFHRLGIGSVSRPSHIFVYEAMTTFPLVENRKWCSFRHMWNVWLAFFEPPSSYSPSVRPCMQWTLTPFKMVTLLQSRSCPFPWPGLTHTIFWVWRRTFCVYKFTKLWKFGKVGNIYCRPKVRVYGSAEKGSDCPNYSWKRCCQAATPPPPLQTNNYWLAYIFYEWSLIGLGV